MDALHAQELKKLKEQGLVKMRLDGPAELEVIAHKNTPNKISHDFNIKKHLMTEFLNRDPDRPTICNLYRGYKSCIVETFLDEEDFTNKLFEGNPAAVCPLAEWLTDKAMQSISKENNLSETAFFVPKGKGFHIRWFTPGVMKIILSKTWILVAIFIRLF